MAAITEIMAVMKNHGGGRMRPSLETASLISDVANLAFIVSLGVGVVATIFIVWMASVKESYWDVDRRQSSEKIASLTAAAAESNRVAEGERLARIRLESALAGRKLTPEQNFKLRSSLASSRSLLQSVNVVRLGDKEASDFADDIIRAILSSGVNVSRTETGLTAPPLYGLHVTDTPDGVLREALTAAGIEHVTYVPTTNPTPSIFVGLKPPPF